MITHILSALCASCHFISDPVAWLQIPIQLEDERAEALRTQLSSLLESQVIEAEFKPRPVFRWLLPEMADRHAKARSACGVLVLGIGVHCFVGFGDGF